MKHIFLESHNINNRFCGFGQFNHHLIRALHQQQYKSMKFTLNASDLQGLKKEFGDFFNYNKYVSLSRYPLFSITKKYDLWHSLNQNTKIEPRRKMPYLMTVHDVHFIEEQAGDDDRKKRFYDKLKRCDALVYISNFAKENTHRHFEIPNIPEYVIYNGNTIQNTTISNDHKPVFVPAQPFLFNIGEMTARKNSHTLVEMLSFLPGFHLILAGNSNRPYFEKVKQTIARHNLESRVHILGKISEKDKKYYLQHCEAFVFPSLREGFGIPPIEAMSYGKPIFLSNSTSLPEIGGKDAFYWDHYDAEYMAKSLQKGLSFYNDNKQSLQKAYVAHANRFNWQETARQYVEVYKTLTN